MIISFAETSSVLQMIRELNEATNIEQVKTITARGRDETAAIKERMVEIKDDRTPTMNLSDAIAALKQIKFTV